MIKRVVISILLLSLAACQTPNDEDVVIPTLADMESLATAIVLTENAPPTGFSTVSFPRIDDNLTALAGWRYDMTFAFDGVFARTPRTAVTSTQASISYNQLGSARRVVAQIDDDIESQSEPITLEGVRLGPDAFLVREDVCLQNAGSDAAVLADLRAGDLLGGVTSATTTAEIATINGVQVWRYAIEPDALILPGITFTDDSTILELRSDLWVSPVHNAVVRFYVTMEVENVLLIQSQLPVSGTIILRYDLYDVGVEPNINVPYGC